ncbi:hypothetical protein L596_006456 [Steinernema carpocapsae]|uniref:Uncharacterized protein n=1 Tax=Steinernema carpocapsae TaxID=34508 RepID=A0A4U8V241_STECR|nr:hypothetical protein L596_006456 [Steinernema carpocapsae]
MTSDVCGQQKLILFKGFYIYVCMRVFRLYPDPIRVCAHREKEEMRWRSRKRTKRSEEDAKMSENQSACISTTSKQFIEKGLGGMAEQRAPKTADVNGEEEEEEARKKTCRPANVKIK